MMRKSILLVFVLMFSACDGKLKVSEKILGNSSEEKIKVQKVDPQLCGNSKVDEGELCDSSVIWDEKCLEGYGMCFDCAQDCQSKVFKIDFLAKPSC